MFPVSIGRLRALVSRTAGWLAAAVVVAAAAFQLAAFAGGSGLSAPGASSPMLPPLTGATAWLQSPPLTPEALRGKVVLVDFWTYSCINCLRTLPHVRSWAQKYRAHGLVVLGVHTPEFDFEGRTENVARAVRDLQIDYPVAVDSRRALWDTFGVQAWPTLVFVDAQGRIRAQQLGEGRYDQAERMIQQLLREAGRTGVPEDLVAPRGLGTQAAPAPVPAASGETYVGAARAQGFTATRGALREGRTETFAAARALHAGQWTLDGAWSVAAESLRANQSGARLAHRFQARDLHLVLGPAEDGRPVRFRVRIDGQPPGVDHGTDTDAQGFGQVDAQRLYQLVRQREGAAERLFEIEFLDAGASAYAFTFG